MYNYRARFYDPLTGSFTQPDSLVPDPLDPRVWNRFGYVYGSPTNFTDPSGHCIEDLCIVETVAVSFIVGALTNLTFSAIDHHLRGTPYSYQEMGSDLLTGGAFAGLLAVAYLSLSPVGIAVFTGAEISAIELTVGQRIGLFTARSIASGTINVLQGEFSNYIKYGEFGGWNGVWTNFRYGVLANIGAEFAGASAGYVRKTIFNSRGWKTLTSELEAATFTIRNPWSAPILSSSFRPPKFDYVSASALREGRPIYQPAGLAVLNRAEPFIKNYVLNSNILPLYPRLYQER